MRLSGLLERRRAVEGDDGFTMIEVIVTIMIIGVVMTAAAGFFINSLRATSGASQRQAAVGLVNQQLELAQATPVGSLLSGRSQTAVAAIQSWSGAAALTARDDTTNAHQKNYDPSATSGSLGTVQTIETPSPVTNKVSYAVRTFINPCWLPVATLQSSSSTVNLACGATYSAGDSSTKVTWLYRVTVSASWTGGAGTSCTNGCGYSASTLIDPSGDHKFNSNLSAPTITTISPGVIGAGATRTITINGSNFLAGAIISTSCADCTVGTTTSNSGVAIVVPITAGTTTGSYTITVVNPDGGRVTSTSPLLSVTPAPSNLSVSPVSVLDYTSSSVTVSGSNISTAVLSGSGGTWGSTSDGNGTATATFTTAGTVGSYPISATNSDGGSGTVPFAVAVSQPTVGTPTQSSFITNNAYTVSIPGTDFGPTGSISVLLGGATTTAISGYVSNAAGTNDTLSFAFVPTSAGSTTFTVLNADGGRSTTIPITVTAQSTPTFTSLSPTSAKRSTATTFTVGGSGFVSGATLTVTLNGTVQTISNLTVSNSTTLTFKLTTPSSTGSYTIAATLKNPDGGTASGSTTLSVTN